MSMMLMVKAMAAKVGNPLRKLVLLKLADQANDQAQCWPSFQAIADACEMSRRSVIGHIEWLEVHGFLVRQRRRKDEGMNCSNVFILTIDEGVSEFEKGGANAALGVVQMLHPNQSIRNSQRISQRNGKAQAPTREGGEVGDGEGLSLAANEPLSQPKAAEAKSERFDALAALLGLGVDAQVAADWLEVRKGKRAKLTQTAIDALCREAAKAGISVAEAVRICAERGWQGFNASWNWRDAAQGQSAVQDANARRAEGIARMLGKPVAQAVVIDGVAK